MRPACANPANIRHVVRPAEQDGGCGQYCYQECVCGEIVSGVRCDPSIHPPHPDGCTCEVTPVFCVDCDAEFMPADPDDDTCAACIAKMAAP